MPSARLEDAPPVAAAAADCAAPPIAPPAADKLTPHIPDAALKKRLGDTVNEIKTIAGARSPALFDLEDKIEVLRTITAETREKLQGMD
jgi:hypothetical protein